MSELGPLHLVPRFAEAIWGGRRLAEVLGKSLPGTGSIGESWEAFGGNPIARGPLAGLTLDEASRQEGRAILGDRTLERQEASDGFPLLIKFIDACHPLSVQVHPDDEFARTHEGGSRGKTEAWYILSATDAGELIYGLRNGVGREEIAASIGSGTLERDLTRLRVRHGDAVFVPAGTVHAIGAGILLYEVQQRSEITYRLYDYGRLGPDGRPRDLHVEKALAVVKLPQPPPRTTTPLALDARGTRPDSPERPVQRIFLTACRYFALEAIEDGIEDECNGATFVALSVVGETTRLTWGRGGEDLTVGETVVLPAQMGRYRLEVPRGGRVLRATVPNLEEDVIAPLRAAGYPDEEIARLGDVPV